MIYQSNMQHIFTQAVWSDLFKEKFTPHLYIASVNVPITNRIKAALLPIANALSSILHVGVIATPSLNGTQQLVQHTDLQARHNSLIESYSVYRMRLFITQISPTQMKGLKTNILENKIQTMRGFETTLQLSRAHSIKIIEYNGATFIYTTVFTEHLMHKIIALIPLLQNNYILNAMTAEEKAVTRLIHDIDTNAENEELWNKCLTAYVHKLYNLKAKQRNTLKSIFQNLIVPTDPETYARKIQNLKDSLDNYISKAREIEHTIRHVLKEQQLETLNPKEIDVEALDYIINSPSLKHINQYESTKLTCVIETPLEFYNTEDLLPYFKDITKSPQNYYSYFKPFMEDIFINQTYKILTTSQIIINFKTGDVARFVWLEDLQCIKQPHIMGFNCWGDNQRPITLAIHTGDFIQGWEQILSAAKNLNFCDTTVFGNFCKAIATKHNTRTVKSLLNTKTQELISITEWEERYEANQVNQQRVETTSTPIPTVPENTEDNNREN